VSGGDWRLAFSGSRILVRQEGEALRPLRGEELADALQAAPGALQDAEVELPAVDGAATHAYDLPEELEPPDDFTLVGLRGLHAHVSEALFQAAGAAYQKLLWLRTHGFCSRCGNPTRRHADHQALECTACGHLHFPRLAPAVIVLVERGDEMLLARSPHFPEGVFSTLAGFVEPGESLEGAVRREILEEVGVEVENIRYFGSQPWPFPHSLMVGFTADWAAGEPVPDQEEIVEAGWFTAHRLPPHLPTTFSIARRLVDDFLERQGGAEGGTDRTG
jgi:NAD+ diphosphatase